MPHVRRATPALIVLVLLVTLGYLSLLRAPPLNWDDDSNIFANPFYRAGDWGAFWRGEYFGLYVPLTSFVWQVLFALGGGAAWPYRVLNAALHGINILLVYRLIRRLGRAPGPALAGAAIFALHPVQVATVAWISGGRDLLAAGLSLGAIDVYLGARGRGGRAAATIFFALALLAKPSAATLPLILWVLRPAPRARDAAWFAGWSALAALSILTTVAAQAEFRVDHAWWQRAWLVGDAYWFYARTIATGWGLAANHGRTPEVVLHSWATLPGAAAGLVVAAWCVWRGNAWRAAALTLLPISGVVAFGYQRTSGVADHYAYLTLAFVGLGLSRVIARGPRRRAAAVVVMALGAVLSHRRLDVYRSNAAFFDDMARAAPESYATAIGRSAVECAERGNFDAGLAWTEVALAARPRDVRALANRAYCLWHSGDARGAADLARVLPDLDGARLARTQPTGYASLLASIGSGQIATGRAREGFALICAAARLRPDDPTHAQNLRAAARILGERGLGNRCE